MTEQTWAPQGVDSERPSGARIYDYLLGGGHNFAVNRVAVAHSRLLLEGNERAGFDLVEPGAVSTPLWRPESSDDLGLDADRSEIFAGLGRKP